MKITFELDDENVIAEALDNLVASHLRSTKTYISQWGSTHPDDIANDAKIISAIDVLVKYYAGENDGQA